MTPEALANLHGAAFAGQGRGWSAEEFAALLQDRHVFLAVVDHGFALGRAVAGEAELLTLAVSPGERRRGLGRCALEAFEQAARERAATRAFLEVGAGNDAASKLYLSAGYSEIARRKGYYARAGGTREDAVIMDKAL